MKFHYSTAKAFDATMYMIVVIANRCKKCHCQQILTSESTFETVNTLYLEEALLTPVNKYVVDWELLPMRRQLLLGNQWNHLAPARRNIYNLVNVRYYTDMIEDGVGWWAYWGHYTARYLEAINKIIKYNTTQRTKLPVSILNYELYRAGISIPVTMKLKKREFRMLWWRLDLSTS